MMNWKRWSITPTWFWSWESKSRGTGVEGQVEEVMFDHLHGTAFQYTPEGCTILGPAEKIHNITKDNLGKYISEH